LAEPIIRAFNEKRHVQSTPIKAAAVPVIVADRDLIGIANRQPQKRHFFAHRTIAPL
jgi:hypothetical protein